MRFPYASDHIRGPEHMLRRSRCGAFRCDEYSGDGCGRPLQAGEPRQIGEVLVPESKWALLQMNIGACGDSYALTGPRLRPSAPNFVTKFLSVTFCTNVVETPCWGFLLNPPKRCIKAIGSKNLPKRVVQKVCRVRKARRTVTE